MYVDDLPGPQVLIEMPGENDQPVAHMCLHDLHPSQFAGLMMM
jgi:hypothetical protein